MRPGQTKTVTVKARDAYGPYEAERVVSVPKTLPYDRELHVQRTVIEPNSELRKSVPAIEVGRTFSTRNFAYTITATNGTHTTLYLLDASENANFDLPFNSTLAVTTPDLFVYVHDVRDGATYRTQWGPYTAQANATHVALMTPYRVGESYRLVQGTAKAIRESPSTVTLDFNHPLAGHDLMFTITIDSIQAVT
jgi:FKBP-type peptidyl-prolyl cis-trans isomerase 2